MHRLLSAVVEALPYGLLVTDPQHRVVAVNPPFLAIAGISARPAELLGVPFDSSAAHIRELFEPDGGREVHCVPITVDGQDRGELWLLHDRSDQVAARQAAAEQGRALADLLALRSDFVATVSHQLRTPLTSIVGLSTLLVEGEARYDAEHAACLQAIGRSADRLLRLADDLTLLAGLESGALPLRDEPVELAELALARLPTWRAAAAAAGIALRYEAATGIAPVRGDSPTLARMLDNLVGTAVAVLPAGGALAVAVRADAAGWLVEVTDETVRMAPGDDPLPAAFATSGAASEAARQTAGLGPLIIRAAARRHHGTVEVATGNTASAGVAGSAIRVRLPA